MGNVISAAYRFAKQYDCMDMPAADDPSSSGISVGVARSGQEDGDMVATINSESHFREFEAKNFSRCFVLGDKIGEGAFSQVFKGKIKGARQEATTFAIKRTVRKGLSKADEKGLFDEVEILQMLNHPNVVKAHQFFKQEPDHYYLVLEFVAGGELFDRIVQKAYFNEEEARNLCRVLIGTVKYCHDRGVVHRDLKPENLLLSSSNDNANIKLADFGLACILHDGNNVTEQCGSPGYVAPEILKGVPYGMGVDMWSIGVIIYTLLGGYPPFHDENQTRLFRRIKAGSFRFHEEYWSDISREAKDIIKRLLIVEVSDRLTAEKAMNHPWLTTTGEILAENDLGRNLEQLRIFNATRKLRAAIKSVIAARRISRQSGLMSP